MTLKNKLLTTTPAVAAEGWDLRTAVVPENFLIGAVSGVWFKPDGTKLFIASNTLILQYDLSVAWDVGTASLVGSFTYGSNTIAGLYFNDTGTVLYATRQGASSSEVRSFGLTTAWNITTASDTNPGASVYVVGSFESNPNDLFFKPDGTKMYVVGSSGDDVNEFNLSTAWDVSTASYVQVFSVSSKETQPWGLFFKDDGTKMYISGSSSDSIHEYNLSTAWDVSTASFSSTLSLGYEYPALRNIYFKPDGTKIYFYDSTVGSLAAGSLSTAWDISSITLFNSTFYVGVQEINPAALFFKPDGTKMYVMGGTGDDVNEYNLSVAWDVSTASYLQLFSVAASETVPTGLFFKPDGTKMYVTGSTGDDVNEYNLSVAWNVSTASYVRQYFVSSQDTVPQAVFFSPDGTKMYVLGTLNDRVYEYSLSTPWSLFPVTYVRFFSISAQETAPSGLFFKDDGTRMYIVGSLSDNIHQYNLSTAWNISTAVYDVSLNIINLEQTSSDIFFKPDGKQIYLIGTVSDRVSTIDL